MKTALLLAMLLSAPEEKIPANVPPCYCGGNPDSKLCCCEEGMCRCLVAAIPAAVHAYRWEWPTDGDVSQVALFDGEVQVGAYHYEAKLYQRVDAKAKIWGEYAKLPCEPPAQPKPVTYQLPSTYPLPYSVPMQSVPNCVGTT